MSFHQDIRKIMALYPQLTTVHFGQVPPHHYELEGEDETYLLGNNVELRGLNGEVVYFSKEEGLDDNSKSFLVDIGLKMEDLFIIKEKIQGMLASHNLKLAPYKPYTFVKDGTFHAGKEWERFEE